MVIGISILSNTTLRPSFDAAGALRLLLCRLFWGLYAVRQRWLNEEQDEPEHMNNEVKQAEDDELPIPNLGRFETRIGTDYERGNDDR
jgi:hypothetical protein